MVSRGKAQSELVKACAAMHGVSDRSVRNWREAKDPRWLEFLSERAVTGAKEPEVPDLPPPDDEPGLGIEFEIRRLRAECRQLAYRARIAERQNDIESEAMLHKMLDPKRETLRRLEKDNPDIGARTGELIPKTLLVHYANEVRGMLASLPGQVATLLPSDISVEIRGHLMDVVEGIMRRAAEIPLTAP